MRRLNLLIALLAALILPLGGLMAAAGPAMASSAGTILKECEDNGAITGHFSRAELQSALSDLSGEVSEYSDCQDLIQQALVRASSPGGGTSKTKAHLAGATKGKNGGGGSSTGSKGGSAGTAGSSKTGNSQSGGKGSNNAVNLAGSSVRPGSSSGTDASSSSLPVTLIIVLILLALTALSGGAVALRRRVDARHST